MKIKLDIDCTPEEARAFLGLPDVQPMQAELMKEIQARLSTAVRAADPELMLKSWLPGGIPGWEQMQKMMWTQMTTMMGGKDPQK
jgi:hypothetical protein